VLWAIASRSRTVSASGSAKISGAEIVGIAVSIGARVLSMARSARGSSQDGQGPRRKFEERGEHQLKGIPGMWHEFALVPPY